MNNCIYIKKQRHNLIVIVGLSFITFLCFASCNKRNTEQSAMVTSAKQIQSSTNDTLNTISKNHDTSIGIDLLKGVWGKNIGENANFQIYADTIYYVEADRRLLFALSDSTMIVFDEIGDTSFIADIIMINDDSLVMVAQDLSDTSSYVKFEE